MNFYIFVFLNARLVLISGETVEEINDSGFIGTMLELKFFKLKSN